MSSVKQSLLVIVNSVDAEVTHVSQVQEPTPFRQPTIFRKEQPIGYCLMCVACSTSHSRKRAVSFKNVNLPESLIYNQRVTLANRLLLALLSYCMVSDNSLT